MGTSEKNPKEMVSIRTRDNKNGGKSLYLSFSVNGVRYRESLNMYLIPVKNNLDKRKNAETLQLAETAKAKKIIEIQSGMIGVQKRPDMLLEDYITSRETYYRNRSSHGTAQGCRELRNHCCLYKGRKTLLSQVDKKYVIGFIEYLQTTNLGQGSQHRIYMLLSIVLNSAVREDLIPENPARRIEPSLKPKEPLGNREFLTLSELQSLINTPCRHQLSKMAFIFACFTGLRISDVRSLKWSQIVPTSVGGMQIQKEQQKTKHIVTIPLSDNAIEWMPERRGNEFVFDGLKATETVDRHLLTWAKEAGINKHVTFHVSRHTNATLLLTYGADLYTVSQLLGHTNIKTTQIYAKIIDDTKKKAVNLIPRL